MQFYTRVNSIIDSNNFIKLKKNLTGGNPPKKFFFFAVNYLKPPPCDTLMTVFLSIINFVYLNFETPGNHVSFILM